MSRRRRFSHVAAARRITPIPSGFPPRPIGGIIGLRQRTVAGLSAVYDCWRVVHASRTFQKAASDIVEFGEPDFFGRDRRQPFLGQFEPGCFFIFAVTHGLLLCQLQTLAPLAREGM